MYRRGDSAIEARLRTRNGPCLRALAEKNKCLADSNKPRTAPNT
jgi:hypothetical protein